MSESSIRIVMSSHGRGEVFIDGEKVKHVTGVEFSGSWNKSNTVTLTLSSPNIQVEGPALVQIDETSIGSDAREFKAA